MRGYGPRFLVVLGRPGCQTSTLIKFFLLVRSVTGGHGRVVYIVLVRNATGIAERFFAVFGRICALKYQLGINSLSVGW